MWPRLPDAFNKAGQATSSKVRERVGSLCMFVSPCPKPSVHAQGKRQFAGMPLKGLRLVRLEQQVSLGTGRERSSSAHEDRDWHNASCRICLACATRDALKAFKSWRRVDIGFLGRNGSYAIMQPSWLLCHGPCFRASQNIGAHCKPAAAHTACLLRRLRALPASPRGSLSSQSSSGLMATLAALVGLWSV